MSGALTGKQECKGGLSEGYQNQLGKESDIGLFSPSEIREGCSDQARVKKEGHVYLDCTLR